MRGLRRGVAIVVAAAGLFALTGALQGREAQEAGRGYPAGEWPLVGGNWSSSRYSTLDDISLDTVDRLGGAWVAPLPGGAASRATPVFRDGVLYLTAGANVFAIDARTGETVWRWQPPADEPLMVPSWQGVGLGEDLVFVGLRSAQVIALRQDTGEPAWATSVGSVPRQEGEGVTTAPMYARGQVFVGLANGDSGGQGRVIALDAETGETQWTFFVVPRPGQFGHDTWPQDSDTWRLGGGGVWLVGTGRSRPRAGLLLHRQPRPDVRRRDSRRRQPVHRVGAGARHGDRRAALALPGGPTRRVGRGHRHAAAALRGGGGRTSAQGAGRDAGGRLPVRLRSGDRRAAGADRGARGAAGRVPAHRAHAAVPGGCREHPAGMLVLARSGPAAVRAELQHLHPAVGGPPPRGGARRADSARARHPDVVQSGDRLRLRAGARPRRARPTFRGSVAVSPERRSHQPPGLRGHHRRRRPAHEPGGLEAGGSQSPARHERPADHSRRPDVPRLARRAGRGLRRPDRRTRVGVPDHSRGGAGAARSRRRLRAGR